MEMWLIALTLLHHELTALINITLNMQTDVFTVAFKLLDRKSVV